jgi:hypothetical protein
VTREGKENARSAAVMACFQLLVLMEFVAAYPGVLAEAVA